MTLLDSKIMKNLRRAESRISRWARQALVSPDLAMARGERAIERELDRWFPTKESFLEALAKVYELVDMTQIDLAEQEAHRFLGDSKLARYFWEQIELADEQYPRSPLLLIFEPTSFGRAKVRCLSAIETARNCTGTGEGKAITTLHALQRIVDELYTPYLVSLDRLGALLAGEKVQLDQKPGKLARRWSESFDDPEIVDKNLVQVRNAAAHGHFRYLGHRRLHLWNESDERWNVDVTTGQLLDLTDRVWNAVTAFEKAIHLYTFKFTLDLLRPALSHMVPLLRGQLSEEQLARINAEYTAGERAMLSRLSVAKGMMGMIQ